MERLKWGILSTANIGTKKVVPGMLKSKDLEVHAIASRDIGKAKKAAEELGIPKAYGSYEELLSDPAVDIIYNPLPNHMHMEWTAKAIEAGKHVLCEKPFFLDPKDADLLIQLRDIHRVKVGEAFMVKSHPQWKKALEIIKSGELGDPKIFNASFSYFNVDPKNIRNIPEYGGGALWDIGCYPVMTSRYLFEENPIRVIANIEKDPDFGTDILSSAILEFPGRKKALLCVSTQAAPYQRVHVLGTKKELEIFIPFNAPVDRPVTMAINPADILLDNIRHIEIDNCDQYQLQAEEFNQAVRNDSSVPVSIEDARDHSLIINALFESAKKGTWVNL